MMTSTPAVVVAAVEAIGGGGNDSERLTAVAAVLALLISIGAFRVAKLSERRQLFIRVHELMTSAESQAGRRLLSEIKNTKQLRRLKKYQAGRLDLINRAVGLYNTLGIYARQDFLSLETAKEHWAETIERSWQEIEIYLRWRREEHNAPTLWPDLVWLAVQCGVAVPADIRLPVDSRGVNVAIGASETRPILRSVERS